MGENSDLAARGLRETVGLDQRLGLQCRLVVSLRLQAPRPAELYLHQ